jgi:amidase
MNRRRFLETGVAAGAGALLPATSAGAVGDSHTQAPVARAPGVAPPAPSDLDEVTVDELQRRFAAGSLTATSLAERYLARIEEIDRRGPALKSVIEVNPDALSIAAERDRERGEGRVRGPLHGVPVLIKDNIDTADRMMTTAGSLALEYATAPSRDAFLVTRLREAGAVILGKTNLSEWANFRSSRSTSGWSGRGGQTRHPYVLDRNPCGSSSGSGVAAAANLAALAVGTETDGSIVCPSSICGLVGLKPTVGLVSRSGIIPISASQDTAGPMTRTVRDAAILLNALAGVDPRDKATAPAVRNIPKDYAAGLAENGLTGKRIGVARKLAGFNERVDALFGRALDVLKQQGAVLVDPADLPDTPGLGDAEFEVLLFEFKAGLQAYFTQREAPNGLRTLKDAIDFNVREKGRELKYFGQDLFVKSMERGPLTSPKYLAALRKCRSASRTLGIDAVTTRHRLDALVAPTTGPAWVTDLLNGDHYTGGNASTVPAVSGYPHVTVPMGTIAGLPVGLSFFGRAWTEATLLQLAYAFEQATKHREPPRFATTVDMLGLQPA